MSFIPLKRLEDVVTFGKYRGKSVHWLLHNDASYLVWAHLNVDWFELEDGIYSEAIDKAYEERMEYELSRIDWGIDVYDLMAD